MRPSFATVIAVLLMMGSVFTHAQQGGISLNQTRVIFSAKDLSQTVAVHNTSDRSWMILSRVQAEEENSDAPFIVTPPLFPLKGNSSQQLRILLKQASLPTDQESLFYLSVAAIPSQSGPVPQTGKLSVGVRFVLKLFYRPIGLPLAPQDSACRLRISPQARGLSIANPTPYFVTMGTLMIDGQAVAIPPQESMIAPNGNLTLAAQHPVHQASWQSINDYGAHSEPCHQTF